MLTGLRLTNFKSWDDTGQVRLAPLTIFFGRNSSGKSSLIQSLLLMKQTAESLDPRQVLQLGGEKHTRIWEPTQTSLGITTITLTWGSPLTGRPGSP
jgi:predicted ATPase